MSVVTASASVATPTCAVTVVPTLKLSVQRRESASAARRRILRERQAAEARMKRMDRLRWLATPKRLRGMVNCEARRFGAHSCMALVYEFADRRGTVIRTLGVQTGAFEVLMDPFEDQYSCEEVRRVNGEVGEIFKVKARMKRKLHRLSIGHEEHAHVEIRKNSELPKKHKVPSPSSSA